MKRALRSKLGSAAVLGISLSALQACSGIRESNGTFVAHGECIRLLGFAIPRDDQQAALDRVPKGGKIESVTASTADWHSLRGFITNLVGYHWTEIGGTK